MRQNTGRMRTDNDAQKGNRSWRGTDGNWGRPTHNRRRVQGGLSLRRDKKRKEKRSQRQQRRTFTAAFRLVVKTLARDKTTETVFEQWVAVDGGWRLMAVGGWRLAVGGWAVLGGCP